MVTMDSAKTTHDLAIIGPLPPPYGGVTVHIQRLLGHLDRAGIDYVVYDISAEGTSGDRVHAVGRFGWRWLVKYLLTGREPVVYLHTSRWDVWATAWWLSRVRGRAVVIALHTDSLRRLWPVRGRLARALVVRAFRAARTLVAVNSHIRDFVDQVAGVGDKTIVAPAFVEPIVREDDEVAVDPAVLAFCESHGPVILANGAPIVYDDGRDLYGIDMTIELVDRLRSDWPQIGVVWYLLKFAGWSPSYAERMAAEVRRRGLDAHWLFVEPTGEMYPAFRHVDLFVRPTCSDGDAVSVREALHFGVPVVTSDAAPRPAGTIGFATRDANDYLAAVRGVLESLAEERAKVAALPKASAVGTVVEMLERIVAESRQGDWGA